FGALCVVGPEPRAFSAELADRLKDLADGAAGECDRSRLAENAARSRAELEATHTLFRVILETAPPRLAIYDREMRVLAAPSQWLQTYRRTEQETIGRCLYDIDPLASSYRAGFNRGLAGRAFSFKPVPTASGRWAQGGCTPWRDADGQVGGIVVAYEDVSELIQ